MPSSINSTSSSPGGLIATGATDNELEIKTGDTTAISIDASQNVTVAGDLTVNGSIVGGGGGYVMTTFTSPGPATWTKPAGLKAVKVTVTGGGGGGAGGLGGFGGGGAGTAIKYIPAPSIPGPVSVTVGGGGAGGGAPTPTANGSDGGTSSFGPFCSATGGGGGKLTPSANAPGNLGQGGIGASGDLNIAGGGVGGLSGAGATTYYVLGGTSFFAGATANSTISTGAAGRSYGGGGTTNFRYAGPHPAAPGGNGFDGVVVVEEFY
jgi:hypothetical protein